MSRSIIYKGITILLILAFLLLVQVQPLNNTVKFLSIFNIFIVVAFFVFQQRFLKNLLHKKAIFLVLILIASYIFSAKSIAAGLNNTTTSEPINKGYVSDEKDFLKIFYYMREGQNYYQAGALAFIYDARYNRAPTDLYSWRLPTAFYIWKFMAADGNGIIDLFIFFSSLSLLAAFLIIKRFVAEEFAIFSPLALMPYFLNAFASTSFLFIEWWSLFPFLFALAFIFNRRISVGVCFLVLSVFVRELMIVPALGISLIFLFKSRKLAPLLIILCSFLIFMFLHGFFIETNLNSVISYSPRQFHFLDKGYLLHILAFSTEFYSLAKFRIGILFTIIASVGFLITFMLLRGKKDKSLVMIGVMASLSLFLTTPFINTSSEGFYSDYWAIIIIPLFMIFSPLIFNIVPFLRKANTKN